MKQRLLLYLKPGKALPGQLSAKLVNFKTVTLHDTYTIKYSGGTQLYIHDSLVTEIRVREHLYIQSKNGVQTIFFK